MVILLRSYRGNGGGVRVMDRRYIYGGKFTPEEDEFMRRQYSLLQGEDRQIMIVFSLLC